MWYQNMDSLLDRAVRMLAGHKWRFREAFSMLYIAQPHFASFCLVPLCSVNRNQPNVEKSTRILIALHPVCTSSIRWLLGGSSPKKKGEAPPDSTFRLGEVETRSKLRVWERFVDPGNQQESHLRILAKIIFKMALKRGYVWIYVSSQAGYFFNSFKCHGFATQLRHRVAEVTSPMQPSKTFRMRAETTKKPLCCKNSSGWGGGTHCSLVVGILYEHTWSISSFLPRRVRCFKACN